MEQASGPIPFDTRESELDELRRWRRHDRSARNLLELTTLYEQRRDIQGVSIVADFFADSVRWSA